MINTKGKLLSWVGSPVSEADFERLYQTELPKIYNFFRFRVGDGPLAEDLTAETFEKAWRKRRRYRRDLASFSTWLYTIARRVAIDYYRKRYPEIPYESAGPLKADETPEDLTIRRADFDRLSALLAQLEERDRELVALRYGAGLTNRAIAGLTGLTESNVGVILHRTLNKLRAEWEKSHER
jgi:RNA polymerase sigma-70 factor (ECF subfamily)